MAGSYPKGRFDMQSHRVWGILSLLAWALLLAPDTALAQEGLDTGDTAWILISTSSRTK